MKTPPVRYANSTDGTQLGYVAFGEGPDLLITGHGGFGLEYELGNDMGGGYYAALGARFRVVLFDPRAVGLSERHPQSITVADDAADIIAIADAAGTNEFALYASCLLGPGAIRRSRRRRRGRNTGHAAIDCGVGTV